jgi:TRAP-type C4-dicarboxylate transport system substrate-binding protein
MKRFPAFAAALGLAIALPVAAQTKWDMPTAYPASNFHTENIQQFANDIDKATGGKLKITVHANASLFKAPEIKRAVQGGQAQLGEILLVNFENEDPLYGIDGIPFLATSYGEFVGAQPVTVQAAEVSQALATGLIDSYMSSGTTGYDSKTYEHIKNFYDTQAWLPKNAVIVNQKAFDALDRSAQAAVLKAAADAETRGWKSSEGKTSWYYEQLKGKGMNIQKPSEQLTADLRKVGNVMLVEWLRKAGDEGRKVVDAYRAM